MKAIIFAAGLGTRLKPLTNDRPKALVGLCGQPLLWHSVNYLKKNGISEVIVNVHHFSEQLIEYVGKTDFGVPVYISDESSELLDTGGGMLKARDFLEGNEPFVACNTDIIASLDLKSVIDYHKTNNPLVTLVVRDRPTARKFLFDDAMTLTGWKNFETGQEIISRENNTNPVALAFSGIHIISPKIFVLIKETGKFSVVDLYLRLSKENRIIGYPDRSNFWLDLGKPGQTEMAEKYLSQEKL